MTILELEKRVKDLEQKLQRLDMSRLDTAIGRIEAERRKKKIEVIDPATYGLQPDTLSTSTNAAYSGDATLNSTALQAAFDGASETQSGEYTIASPAGIYRVNAKTTLRDVAGLNFVFGGCNLGQGDTPEATSWYASAFDSNFFKGTEIYATGLGSDAVFDFTDVTCIRGSGLGIRGDGTDPVAYGIRVGKATSGLGPSTIYWEQLCIQNADVGMNVGRVATSSGGYVAANCSEVVLVQPLFKVCDIGYQTMHGQAVNHCLIQPQHTNGSALYQQTGGSNVLLLQPVTFDSEALIESSGGGSSAGTILVLNGRFDGQEYQTKLWNATASAFNVVTFISCNYVYSAATPTGPRITMYDNNYINILFCHNLSDGTSKPIVESANTGAKTLFIMGSRVEVISAGDMDSDKAFGTWHSGGEWRFIANIDNTNSKFMADREYPRRNGRSSTHRYQIESDFESTDVGPYTVSTSGAGATYDIVQPWDPYRVGILSLETGSTTSGSAACISDVQAVEFKGGPWRCEIGARLIVLSATTGVNPDPLNVSAPYGGTTGGITGVGTDSATSDADETFVVRLGFCDSDAGDGTDGAFFRYTDSVNGGRWQAVTRDGGSETATDTGVTADQDPAVFEIRVNPDCTSVKFYIDGTLVATNTTNLPDADEFTGMMPGSIVKTAGTNSRAFHIDYAYYDFVPSAARGTAFNK